MTPLICTTYIGKLCFMKKKKFVQNVTYLECCNSEFCFKETVCGMIAIIHQLNCVRYNCIQTKWAHLWPS